MDASVGRWATALLLVSLLQVQAAQAQCSGGDDGDADDSDDDYDSCPFEPEASGGYGGGRGTVVITAPLVLSFGALASHVPLDDVTFGGAATHDENPLRYSIDGDALGRLFLMGGSARVDLFLGDAVYVGAELQFAAGDASGSPTDRVMEVEPLSAGQFGAGAALGLRIPVGPFALRAEIAGGGRVTWVHARTRIGSCVAESDASWAAWTLAPRLLLDVPLGGPFGVTAWAGSDLLLRGSVSAGLAFALDLSQSTQKRADD